jgi:hypothetical protein
MAFLKAFSAGSHTIRKNQTLGRCLSEPYIGKTQQFLEPPIGQKGAGSKDSFLCALDGSTGDLHFRLRLCQSFLGRIVKYKCSLHKTVKSKSSTSGSITVTTQA